MPAAKSSIFSNLLVMLGALAAAGGVFWFIYTSLGPVDVPPVPPERRPLKFDTKADVSQNQTFNQLRPLISDFSVEPENLGRPNPFMPVPKAVEPLPGEMGTGTEPGGLPAMIPYEIPKPQTEEPAQATTSAAAPQIEEPAQPETPVIAP